MHSFSASRNHALLRIPLLRIPLIMALAAMLLLTMFTLLQQSRVARAATTHTYPGASAPCNGTLQTCINGAAAGDTIQISAGSYVTHEIVVDKPLTLNGAGASSTVLQALPNQRVISISSHLAGEVVIGNLAVEGGNVAGDGGGLHSGSGTRLRLLNVEVRDNNAGNSQLGGGAYVAGPLTAFGGLFTNNHAPGGSGGGIYAESTIVLTGVRFIENRALFGGGLRVLGDAQITASQFITNRAADSLAALGDGGGAFVDGQFVTVTASLFVSNSAATSAGALWAEVNATITATRFISNSAGATAGGLQVNGGTGQVSGGSFSGNVVGPDVVDLNEQGGGAIYQGGGDAAINGVSFRDNRSEGQGGAVGGEGVVVISSSLFDGNSAASSGGALIFNGPVFISETTFMSNSANLGGALAIPDQARITGTLFLSNSAATQGGAVAISGNSAIIQSVFDANRAEQGGALWYGLFNTNGFLHSNGIDRVILTRNEAVNGGAILVNDTTEMSVTNTLLVDNLAAEKGGAIASFSPSLKVINATLVANRATTGEAIHIGAGGFALANSIVWDHESGAVVGDVPLSVAGPNTIQHGELGGLNQDPRFMRNPNRAANDLGDLHLSQFSPAIDRGNGGELPLLFEKELDEVARRFDVTAIANTGSGEPPIDLGAFEANTQLPAAEANGAYSGDEGTPVAVTADGSTSGDEGQALDRFAWDCTGNGSFDVFAVQPNSACLYPDQGAFTLRLLITDTGNFTAEDTAAVNILNVAPSLSALTNHSATAGEAAAITLGQFADPGADAPWLVRVDWGDEQSTTFTHLLAGVIPAATHIYARSGLHTVTVTVTDKDGGSGSATFEVNVAPAGGAVESLLLPKIYR